GAPTIGIRTRCSAPHLRPLILRYLMHRPKRQRVSVEDPRSGDRRPITAVQLRATRALRLQPRLTPHVLARLEAIRARATEGNSSRGICHSLRLRRRAELVIVRSRVRVPPQLPFVEQFGDEPNADLDRLRAGVAEAEHESWVGGVGFRG